MSWPYCKCNVCCMNYAAPDMLAALKQITAHADERLKKYFRDRSDQCGEDYAVCMAAIAKAEGRTADETES